jgi:hypothetical protein
MSDTRQIGKRKQITSKIMLTGLASVVGNHLKLTLLKLTT